MMMMMMMRRESQSPTVAGVLTELYSVAGAATGSDTACCAGLLACLLQQMEASPVCRMAHDGAQSSIEKKAPQWTHRPLATARPNRPLV